MKKRTAALIFALILILSFSSCSGKIKSYVDKDGNTYDIVYDSDGNFITNDNNKLKVYVLSENGKRVKSENGEYRTDYIDFNGQITDGRNVETKELSFKLPVGFEQSYDTGLLFLKDSISAIINISTIENTDAETKYSEIESNCVQLQESYGNDKFEYSVYDLNTRDNINIHVFKQQCTASDYPFTNYYYYFNVNDKLYEIYARVQTDSVKKADFDSFAKSFVFK